jgi:flagellar protein FlgJ
MLPVNISAAGVANRFGQDVYTDLNQLNNINRIADEDQHAALKKMAQQFEGLFIQLMLKTMREASAAFVDEQSSEMDFHQSMFDNQLALNLSSDRGIGLADSFYQQMLAQYSEEEVANRVTQRLNSDLSPAYNARPSSPTISPPGRLESIPSDPENFVKAIYPQAERVAARIGVDPSVLVAQSALETGWGKHVISDKYGRSSYNLFNIKADKRWSGDKVPVQTIEFKDGLAVKEDANFRRYRNISDSFTDYAQFILTEPRYNNARQAQDGKDYLRALQSSGYATDPNYADKVIELLDHDLIRARRQQHHSEGP